MGAAGFLVRKILDLETQGDKINALMLAVRGGVTEDTIVDIADKSLWSALLTYYQTYGRVPSQRVLEYESEIEVPEAHEDPVEYWIDEVRNSHSRALMLRTGNEIIELTRENNVRAAIDCMAAAYTEALSMQIRNHAIYWVESIPDQIEEHRQKQLGLLEPGALMGIEYLDSVTFGAQPGDNWALVGRPEVGKSYVLARMLMGSCLFFDTDVTVYSMEMPKEQWSRRNSALATHLNATLMRSGRLSFVAIDVLRQFYQQMLAGGMEQRYKVIEGVLDMSTADILMEIQQASRSGRKRLVGVDGAYLLRPSDRKQRYGSRWERAMTVMEELRKIALQTGTPIVGTYQFSRQGEKKGLEGIGGTDAIGQLNAVVLGLMNETDHRDARHDPDSDVIPLIQYKILEIMKGREGEKGKIRLLYNMARTAIEQDRVLRRVQGSMSGSLLFDEPEDSSLDEIFED